MKQIKWIIPGILTLVSACGEKTGPSDAYGNFEAVEIMVSSEVQGGIREFIKEEGDRLSDGELVLTIDSIQLCLKREQLLSGLDALRARIGTLDAQVEATRVQLENLEREKQRTDQLAEGGAATAKQQDDIAGQIELLKAQIAATESQKASVFAERKSLEIQVRQVEDQIGKCRVRNPQAGVLLTKYREQGELAVPGQPLYKVADMERLILRAYISGSHLASVRTGEEVRVRFDAGEGVEETGGVVTWISPRAEFTPKIIQTREERVNLVYAVKVMVPNDGRLKIGMPGEVVF